MYRYLVLGMYRSGSTRMFNITKDLLADRCGGKHHVRGLHRGNAPEAYAEMRRPGPLVLKEHELTVEAVHIAGETGVSVIGTIREPVGAVVSLMSTFDWPEEVAVNGIRNAIETLESFGGSITLVRYETAVTEDPRVLQQLMATVGLDCGWATARTLCRRYGRTTLESATTAMALTDGALWDPETLFHPGHVGTPHRVMGDDLDQLAARVCSAGLTDRYAALLDRAI